MSESCETNKLINEQIPVSATDTEKDPTLTRRDVIADIAAKALVFAFGSSVVMRLFGKEAAAAPIKPRLCGARPLCIPRPFTPPCPSSPCTPSPSVCGLQHICRLRLCTPRPLDCGLTPNVCLATHGCGLSPCLPRPTDCGLTPNLCLDSHGCGLKPICSTIHNCGLEHFRKFLEVQEKSPDIVDTNAEGQESTNEEKKQKSKEMLRSAVREILKRLETELTEGDK